MTTTSKYTVDVLVTTYQRPEFLTRCLDSLRDQTLAPTRVVVVVRDTDIETAEIVSEYAAKHTELNILAVTVTSPGVVAANNAAYRHLQSEIVVFIDDDASAPPTWLEMLLRHYNDPSVGAVGGRIRNHRQDRLVFADRVFARHSNRLTIFGRMDSGQMYQFQGVREVDFLTGCNMSFRRKLLAPCDMEIKGDGYCYEVDLCLTVKTLGFRVILDAEAVNDHWSAPRREGPARNDPNIVRCNNRYNETYVFAKHRRAALFVTLRAIFYWLPRDIAGMLLGRKFRPWRCLVTSFQALRHGSARGREILQRQIQTLTGGEKNHTDGRG
ncbi:MAG: glycosyltransferase family 2 protein [Kiritimatiellia bacterium]|jgi:GT2 family glycosyltransferase